MDIDFPLILFILVVVSGVVWCIDRFALAKRRAPEQPTPAWIEYSGSFFPVLLLVFILRSFLFEPFQIPSGSMIPTLKVGDFILVNKFSYGIRLPILGTKVLPVDDPERGDVMVFSPPGDDRYFIKRVIGLPGDEIRVIDNQLFVNGEPAQQLPAEDVAPTDPRFDVKNEVLGEVVHHIQKKRIPGPLGGRFSYVVPQGHYFMMGDNRDNSSDSRVWGPVPDKNIVGKAVLIWMHWESIAGLPSFDRVGIIQ